jgi:hypothetical protein
MKNFTDRTARDSEMQNQIGAEDNLVQAKNLIGVLWPHSICFTERSAVPERYNLA